jgi:hypothetical protein
MGCDDIRRRIRKGVKTMASWVGADSGILRPRLDPASSRENNQSVPEET